MRELGGIDFIREVEVGKDGGVMVERIFGFLMFFEVLYRILVYLINLKRLRRNYKKYLLVCYLIIFFFSFLKVY